ncbi:hypothetical protein [Parapedobacter koreensis]|uniref:Uncharacterized protein n=1 Tax=Parapedobacter koreensis TaxID=332977 RepID=A0A1H7PYR8_9SPHI|nr:hypothetical protein [Parapedobacter koreensis]SEL40628.1 hypothetical protein SAMN05421740_10572 [Parapedobacter koreensis]
MKRTLIKKLWLSTPLLAISLWSASYESKKDFKIEISEDGKVTTLICQHGCAWKELSFTKPTHGDAAMVNQFGMASFDEGNTAAADGSLAEFSFTITKKAGKYVLKGVNGTAWKSLSFSLKPYAAPRVLDASGVTVR